MSSEVESNVTYEPAPGNKAFGQELNTDSPRDLNAAAQPLK